MKLKIIKKIIRNDDDVNLHNTGKYFLKTSCFLEIFLEKSIFSASFSLRDRKVACLATRRSTTFKVHLT